MAKNTFRQMVVADAKKVETLLEMNFKNMEAHDVIMIRGILINRTVLVTPMGEYTNIELIDTFKGSNIINTGYIKILDKINQFELIKKLKDQIKR